MDLETWLVLVALLNLATAMLGSWVAVQKGRSQAEGAILGFLFGPIGAVIEALLPSQEPKREYFAPSEHKADVIDDKKTLEFLGGIEPPKPEPPPLPEWMKDIGGDRPGSRPPRTTSP
jgi:hypothetical protein